MPRQLNMYVCHRSRKVQFVWQQDSTPAFMCMHASCKGVGKYIVNFGYLFCSQLEAKESATVKALKEDFGAVVAKKDEEIQRLTDSIRGLQPIADKFKVLFAEKRDLQHQFDVVMRTNQEVQQMFRNMQSEKAAAESRVKELSMVVGQVTTENEALTQQNSHLVQQIEVQIAFHFAVYALGILLHGYSPVCICTVQT